MTLSTPVHTQSLGRVRTADFHYDLPPELVAQEPAPERDGSRLLVLDRVTGGMSHERFPAIVHHLRRGDLLVLNDSRVIPARLRGVKEDSGGAFEILLLSEDSPGTWWTLLRPAKRVRPGTRLRFHDRHGNPTDLTAEVLAKNPDGHVQLRFATPQELAASLDAFGEPPLPPYIHPADGPSERDRERYQTVYARHPGSVAAPTAGLHFTERLLQDIESQGVAISHITLHVGGGTFLPVKADRVADHRMHTERFNLPAGTASAIARTRASGGRVVAVGTTTVRVLETLARRVPPGAELPPGPGTTDIFLHPPAPFHVVDALITNFHLPESTLLMLVSAFADPGGAAGRDRILAAYREAIRLGYRFFSYGDAMLLQ